MAVPGGYGRRGIPDFLVCHRGYFIAIEAKRLDGKGRLSGLQVRELASLREAEAKALVVESEDDLKKLEALLGRLRTIVPCVGG